MADLKIQYKLPSDEKSTTWDGSVDGIDGKVDTTDEAQAVQDQIDQFKKDNPKAKIVRIFVDKKTVTTSSIKKLLADTEAKPDKPAEDKAGDDSSLASQAASWIGEQLGLTPEEEAAKPKPKAKGKGGKGKAKQPKASDAAAAKKDDAKTPVAEDDKKADAADKSPDKSEDKKDFTVEKGTQEAVFTWTNKGKGYRRLKKGIAKFTDSKYYKVGDDGKAMGKPIPKSEAFKSGRTSDKQKEEKVLYTSDGQVGLNEEEAQSIIEGLAEQGIDVDSLDAKEVEVQVADKAKPLNLGELKGYAGGRIKDAEIPADSEADPTDDILKPDPLQQLVDDPANFAAIEKMKLQKRKLDALIALLISLLASGRGDVDMLITAVLQAIAQKNNMTLGELGAKLAKQLGAKSEEAEEIGEQLEKAYKGKNSAKAAAAVSRLRLKLQNNQQSMSQIKSMLEQAMSQRNQNDELASGYARKSNRHAERMSIFS